MAKPRQRLFLDLAHALARDAEKRADLLEGHWLAAIEAEVETENLGVPFLEVRQRLFDRLGERLLEGLLVRRGVERVRQVVEQLVVFTGGHRRIERQMRL